MTAADDVLVRPTAGSLPLLSHLRTLLKAKHKKTYTVAVGKLNPAKLANFAEVECFVLVACGENTLVDSRVRPCSPSSPRDLSFRPRFSFILSQPRNGVTPSASHLPRGRVPSLQPTFLTGGGPPSAKGDSNATSSL